MLESAYDACLSHELPKAGLPFDRQVPLSLVYDGVVLSCAYRADFIVDRALLVELKVLGDVTALHHAQALTYLRLAGVSQALRINFNVPILKYGLKSFVATASDAPD